MALVCSTGLALALGTGTALVIALVHLSIQDTIHHTSNSLSKSMYEYSLWVMWFTQEMLKNSPLPSSVQSILICCWNGLCYIVL